MKSQIDLKHLFILLHLFKRLNNEIKKTKINKEIYDTSELQMK